VSGIYHTRKSTIERLLNDYNLIASVPDLRYAGEEQKLGLNSYSRLSEMIKVLNSGLKYLDIIKKVREDSK